MNNQSTEAMLFGQLAKGTGIAFSLGIGGYFLMFLFKFVAAKYYGPTDLGLLEMTNTVVLILILISTLGIPAGITRYVPLYKYRGEHQLLTGYIRSILITSLIVASLISLFLFSFADSITQFFNFPSDLEPLIKIASFIIPFRTLSHIFRKILISEKKIFLQTLSESILEKSTLLLFLCLCIFFHLPIFFVVFGLLLSTLLSFFFDLFLFLKKINLPKKIPAQYRHWEWLAFSLPLLLSGFFTFFIQWSDNILVGKLMGASLLGIYALAYSLADFIGFLQIPFLTMFTPLSAEQFALEENKSPVLLFQKTVGWLFMLSLGFVIILILFGKELLSSFFGPLFSPGYAPLVILSGGFLLYNIFSISEALLILHKKTRLVFSINFATASLNIILNIIFIGMWGIIGAAIASILAINIKGIATYISAKNNDPLSLPSRTLLKALAAGCLAFFIGLFLKTFFDSLLLMFIILPVSIFILYTYLLFLFRAITKEDRNLLYLFIKRLGAPRSVQ